MQRHRHKTIIFLCALFLGAAVPGVSSPGATSAPIEEVRGSWARGLAEYVAKHAVAEKNNWENRKKLLLEYELFVSEKNETSLRVNRNGNEATSRAIGLGKTSMVFHLLRRISGEEVFSRISRELLAVPARTSWDDIKALFEKETGRDLGVFFSQWVDRKGLPELGLEKATVRRSGSRFEISFDVVQKGDVYTLDVPVVISFLQAGRKTELIKLDSGRQHIELVVDDEPESITLDQDYDLPRRLAEEEIPPLFARLAGDENTIIVPPVTENERYSVIRETWSKRGALERRDAEIKDTDIKASSLLVLGAGNPVISRLYGTPGKSTGRLSLLARKNPWNGRKVVVTLDAESAETHSGEIRFLLEDGEFSSLEIDAQGQRRRQTAESQRGMVMNLRSETAVIDVSALRTLQDVIEKASDKRIVYVGEFHDRPSHHQVQLRVIKTLHRNNPKLAVGMEMFQRPFQKVLDEYIGGNIDEREFLKRSEYFKRWSFDFNLYKPILDYARAEKIPVIALNIKGEIVEKVSKSGMDSLTDEEKREVPGQMDFSDAEYRDRLKEVYEQHKGREKKNFDFFYQAQLLWDETMAQSVAEYLQKNDGFQMIVLAGAGHLTYGSGIPKRAHRRNGFSYATILNDGDVDQDIADFLVYPEPLEYAMSPKLMVVLKETAGEVSVRDLPKGSIAKAAGMKTGDVIISIDGEPVRTAADVKLQLFYKKQGETVNVRVLRKRFLFGDTETELQVKLPQQSAEPGRVP